MNGHRKSCHSCHATAGVRDFPEGVRKIVLVGNPNVGKSVFFNALTGMYVDVSNFPGTTVEITSGYFGKDLVIDTPGVYGVSSFNEEEIVARDIILKADIIVNVVDAVHLERDLFLTLQCIDMGIPMIVVLNMMDEVRKHGIEIDIDLLGDLLGVPVIPATAIKKIGIEEVKEGIYKAKRGNADHDLEEKLQKMASRVGSQAEALLIYENDLHVAKCHGVDPIDEREEIYAKRRHRVNDIVGHVVKEAAFGVRFSVRLGRAMLKPITGIPMLLLTLYAMFKLIGVFVAGDIVYVTEEVVMLGIFEPTIKTLVGTFIAEGSAIGKILIGEFGLLTMTPVYVLGLLLPLVAGFYFFLSILEDSGYLPRIAALVDRTLTGIGLNGRAVIPMILGFGCVTMATITTRLLGSERERTIATTLLGLAIPCSAQLGVIIGMLSGLGTEIVVIYSVVIFSVFVVIGTLLNRVLPGKSTDLLIDLPPLRIPKIGNVLKKAGTKTYMFLKEATPLFALGALLISLMELTGILTGVQDFLAPLTQGWLQLPKETANVFIMGIIRRDFGAAGLTSMPLTSLQSLIGLIVITLFVPCIAAVLVIFKERGLKEASMIWIGSFVTAFLVGGVISQLLI
jgi:ferrous iron transport protein B